MLETIVTVLAILAAGVIFWAIWADAVATIEADEDKDEDGFDASAARWGYLQDKRND